MKFYNNLEKVLDHFEQRKGGFLTVKHGARVNTMTISWGFVGFLWASPYFITVVRPQRYTRELIDGAADFTVSVPLDKSGGMERELSVCGTKSGRDIDKGSVVNFTPARSVGSPVVAGCDMYYECVIRYRDDMKAELMPRDILEKLYKGDLHRMYYGEIVDCYGGS
jgi:flavin reductase (DIM6/NTAB) family NADH-FMN oxidoreductase RutF